MRSLLTIGFILLGLYSRAQDVDRCYGDNLFVKAEQMPVFKKNTDSLKAFFAPRFPALEFATGKLFLEIIVCTNGKAILDSSLNKTDMPVSEQSLVDWISTMPLWKPGVQNGRLVDCSVHLELTLEEGIVIGLRYTNNSL